MIHIPYEIIEKIMMGYYTQYLVCFLDLNSKHVNQSHPEKEIMVTQGLISLPAIKRSEKVACTSQDLKS